MTRRNIFHCQPSRRSIDSMAMRQEQEPRLTELKGSQTQPAKKKPYQKPAFRYERVLKPRLCRVARRQVRAGDVSAIPIRLDSTLKPEKREILIPASLQRCRIPPVFSGPCRTPYRPHAAPNRTDTSFDTPGSCMVT